ncbi:MAG: DUF655 domain-containing protein [Candidatus Bathyarchaeota archaeon]|nr:MAG: DUF655 domain-containing protein [Candidatus Bathyarchaeota archaeon]
MTIIIHKKFEDYAYVLDYLSQGRINENRQSFKTEALVQLIGTNYFTLLEATPRTDIKIAQLEKVYIGKELPRRKISHIAGRINYRQLTSTAKSELPGIIEKIIVENPPQFIAFFNTTQAVTPRMHSLELVPGIGKKYMWAILQARERKPFDSFQEIQERTGIPDPVKLVSKRILEELHVPEPKYRLFTRSS